MSKRTVTINFEFSDYFLSDLQQMERDGPLTPWPNAWRPWKAGAWSASTSATDT